jgi:hypothetical protein
MIHDLNCTAQAKWQEIKADFLNEQLADFIDHQNRHDIDPSARVIQRVAFCLDALYNGLANEDLAEELNGQITRAKEETEMKWKADLELKQNRTTLVSRHPFHSRFHSILPEKPARSKKKPVCKREVAFAVSSQCKIIGVIEKKCLRSGRVL